MQFTSNAEIHWNGDLFKILYADDVQVLLEQTDTGKSEVFPRDQLEVAYMQGQLTPYEHGYTPSEWQANAKLTLELANDWERDLVEYRLPYARYFRKNIVSAKNQAAICKEIAKRQGHSVSAPPSTARRWAKRLRDGRDNPAALIDRRCTTIRSRGIIV